MVLYHIQDRTRGMLSLGKPKKFSDGVFIGIPVKTVAAFSVNSDDKLAFGKHR